MAEFITSDSHFCHSNILEFEERLDSGGNPFSSVPQMEEAMIDAWNAVVRKTDTVYHLGDFCFGGVAEWQRILNELRGNIIFVKGNHDKSRIISHSSLDGLLAEVHPLGTVIKRDKMILNLSHYPMLIGARPRNFSVHGHLHSYDSGFSNHVNVGVDGSFAKSLGKPFGTPIAMEELIDHLRLINGDVIKEKEALRND